MALRLSAMRIMQPSGRYVYAFAATPEQILTIATIPRIGRSDEKQLLGYQRPEAVSHILEIRRYLDMPDSVLPNTVVLAFRNEVQFHGAGTDGETCQYGQLVVPDTAEHQELPAFVIDGQQRLAAMASCRHPRFPVFVTAMVVPDVAEQRRQFVLVNRTKPLPQGLIYELLPEITGYLPDTLLRQRLAAAVLVRLNLQGESALHRMIKTPTCPIGVIKDNSLRRLILNSLSDGALLAIYLEKRDSSEGQLEMTQLVSTFWDAVQRVFPKAWGLPPERSRLMHGVGIVAMGFVMDHLYARKGKDVPWTCEKVIDCLSPLVPYCAWTEGDWPFTDVAPRRWNELQNTDRDVRILTNHFRRALMETELADASIKRLPPATG